MNPMTNVKNIQKLNERMLDMGVEDDTSWHKQYKNSAYIFIGGLPYDLTEGDILCVFSQYGEIVNLNLVRDKATGKQKGFCFLCYEDQRSTILAVDNFNGIKLGGRTIRVDHCENYRKPKGDEKDEDGNRKDILEEGCAPKVPSSTPSENEQQPVEPVKKKKLKKHKEKKSKFRRKEYSSSSESEDGQVIKHKKWKKKSNKIKSYSEQDSSREKRDLRLQEVSHLKATSKQRDERTLCVREWDYGKKMKQDRHVDIEGKRKKYSHNEDRSLDHKDRREKLSDRRDQWYHESPTRVRSKDYNYSERKR